RVVPDVVIVRVGRSRLELPLHEISALRGKNHRQHVVRGCQPKPALALYEERQVSEMAIRVPDQLTEGIEPAHRPGVLGADTTFIQKACGSCGPAALRVAEILRPEHKQGGNAN